MRGLYAIVDLDALAGRDLDAVRFAAALLEAPLAALQLRAKHASARDTLALLDALRPLTRDAGVPLFANDRPDLALLAGCDGVHLGQDDVPLALARKVAPGLEVGLSIHNETQLAAVLTAAPEAQPDVLAFGPVFTTRHKENPDPALAVEGLASLCEEARVLQRPCVAIGGIDLARAGAVAEHADALAVIGALLPPRDLAGEAAYRATTAQATALAVRIEETTR